MKKFQKFRVSNLIDPLSKLNGIRFNSLYVQFGEGEQKDKVYVQKKEITGKYFSTMYTVCGSLVWLALLILSATSTLSRWGRFEPAINEVNLEDEGVSLALPDIAITFSVNDFTKVNYWTMYGLYLAGSMKTMDLQIAIHPSS